MPKMETKIRDRFTFKDFPSLNELEKKTAIMLVNSDNAVDYPEPLQPNMIQVGGLQIMKPKELSKVSCQD
jgi:UDP-glucoronosyl and UDP-glucosyl transferase